MIKIGIFELSGMLKQEQLDLLSMENIELVSLKKEEIEQGISFPGVIIVDEKQKSIGESCKVITQLRENKEVLIWMYGDQISEINRLIYLQLGVDSNIEARQQELYLIIRNALLRRNEPSMKEKDNSFFLNGVNQSVIINGNREIGLTRLEYKVLSLLNQQPKKAINYENIYRQLWGEEKTNCQPRVANIIFNLRKKVEIDPLNPKLIRTIRNKGYMFVPQKK